ncbi:MAG: glycosyltransferase [Cytophagaceae bacterium]|nr:glycosyltransferase [Cytophagaceae bacterium]MDW8455434.1 glycosyltransferase family protein [Cytophagaceae bacterium]
MNNSAKKFFFIVQGEGRGHMTQAISLYEMLTNAGHNVCAVMVGKSKRRVIPDFFYKKINTEIILFESPNFVTDKKSKAIKIGATIWNNLLRGAVFIKNLSVIDKEIKKHNPDVVINFYDLLAGMYFWFYHPKPEYVCVGHQYLLLHPDFQFPKKRSVEKFLVKLNTRITQKRASKLLALSFREFPHYTKQNIYVVPPLLRKEVLNIVPQNKNFILGYMVNSGYGEDMIQWHEKNKHVVFHIFWDNKDVQDEYKPHENITFHHLNDKKFLEYMANCTAYVSTAGFESICEAMYLGKPVMMVPIKGQYEQLCNAHDAAQAGAGIMSDDFNINKLIDYLPSHKTDYSEFKKWVMQAKEKILKELS